MTCPRALFWFRKDLRLADNPALLQAVSRGAVLPIYILDQVQSSHYQLGAASRWWLHYSLASLKNSLGGALSFYCGNPLDIVLELVARYSLQYVSWNHCYEPWCQQRDASIATALKARGITVMQCNASLLWEPWSIHKQDGSAYRVFTPFYRKGCLLSLDPRRPLPLPQDAVYCHDTEKAVGLDSLELLPRIRWDASLTAVWSIGEQAAIERFRQFRDEGLPAYHLGRNYPAQKVVSRLSPHLHFGEISPNTLWYGVQQQADSSNVNSFCSELGWREFSYNLLYHNPQLPQVNLQSKFDAFAWNNNQDWLHAWQRGNTGIPMVDAGMRELWTSGYMHGRLRMIVGSFLVKNLRIHWHHGERWFWDTLVDADIANNSASWQWIAGCGADAVPYFRIFNPVTQGHKFDPTGAYVRQHLPELASLPTRYLFSPWQAPTSILDQAGVRLGTTYPWPVVDLAQSRAQTLKAFYALKSYK